MASGGRPSGQSGRLCRAASYVEHPKLKARGLGRVDAPREADDEAGLLLFGYDGRPRYHP